jgi:ankyrin repeat protein
VEGYNVFCFTALHMAALGGHAGIVARLIDASADVRAIADDDSTPLSLAVSGGHAGAVAALLDAGVRPPVDLHADTAVSLVGLGGGGGAGGGRLVSPHMRERVQVDRSGTDSNAVKAAIARLLLGAQPWGRRRGVMMGAVADVWAENV